MSTVYTHSHEWLRDDAKRITIGITDYGQGALGEIVFVELPTLGARIEKGAVLCVVESVKAASEIISPIAGVVEAKNDALQSAPQLINSSAEEQGWICAIRVSDALSGEQFLNLSQYRALINS